MGPTVRPANSFSDVVTDRGVTDRGSDDGTTAHIAFDGLGGAALLTGDIYRS
jgi:hypothetical protein